MCLESFDSDGFNDGFCHSTSRFDECLSVDSVSECRRYIIISRKCSTICMEVVGMKKALFKIIIPLCVLVLWMITCYPVCNKADGFDYFLYWILVGCPYGIRKMCMFLVPKNFGIAGSMGILALNCIVGGLIGGIIVFVRIIVIFTQIIKVIAGHFWTQCPKV